MTLVTLATVVATLAATFGLASVAPANAAAWTAPAYERSIGARGNAGIYAWGMAYNPVSDEVIVGDYMNFQLRRYSRSGTLLGSFYQPAAQRRGHPESVAVDPRDGAIYTSDRSRDDQGYIAKFDKAGTFLWELKLNASYHAWIAVDAAGFLYVSDSHVWHTEANPPQVRKYLVDDVAKTSTEVAHWGAYGSGPGQIHQITGLAVGANGNVYAADTLNRTVHVWTGDGTFVRDIGVGGTGAGQFLGDLRGVTVNDATGTLYVVDAQASQVERFDLSGNPLGSWGTNGTGQGQFGDGGRQIALDSQGEVWVSDFGNARFHRFGATGSWVGTYPSPAQNAPTGALSLPRDVAVDPVTGDVLAVEQNNHRFQRFAADGTPISSHGRRSSERPLGFNYPRGIAIEPGNGRIWVANTNQDSVRVLNPDLTLAFEVGGEFGTDPGQFKNPLDIELVGGKAYISDYAGVQMKVFDAATGIELWGITKAHSGVAVDPATGHIYLSSWQTDVIWHYNADGTPGTPAKFGSKGIGPGQFMNGWDIDVVGGVVYATDSDLFKVVAFSTTGTYLGQWGTQGTGPGQFNNPSGLTHDAAGRLYVADAGNDRIQVFNPALAPPVAGAAPSLTITSPIAEAVVPAPAVLTGTVTDDIGIGTVELAIQDRVSKLWWDGKIATWTRVKNWTTAGVKGSSQTSKDWWFPFIGIADGGQYLAQARAKDSAGMPSVVVPTRRFSLASSAPADTVVPDSTITAPTVNAVLPSGVLGFAGAATDNVGVASTQVAVQDRTTRLWWNAATSAWATAQTWATAALSAPGSTTTSWSYSFDEGAAAGSDAYVVVARAKDAAGNVETVRPSARFTTTP